MLKRSCTPSSTLEKIKQDLNKENKEEGMEAKSLLRKTTRTSWPVILVEFLRKCFLDDLKEIKQRAFVFDHTQTFDLQFSKD